MSNLIDPAQAWIFRVTHVDNLAWILENGLHARRGAKFDPNYRSIGNPDLIDKRSRRLVPIAPFGTLSDYVPFYFTPYSIMLYNIHTGYGGIAKVPQREIAMLVCALPKLQQAGIPFVFTNQHAYPVEAEFFSDLAELGRVDWALLRSRNFKHDPEDPQKKERYQAEALVWQHVPVDALSGICCYDEEVQRRVDGKIQELGLGVKTAVRPQWYHV